MHSLCGGAKRGRAGLTLPGRIVGTLFSLGVPTSAITAAVYEPRGGRKSPDSARSEAGGAFVPGNRVVLIEDAAKALRRMLQSIEAAQSWIWLEMYWFDSDAVGKRFFDALTDRASRGIEVFVLYDALGSFGTDTARFEQLIQAGARVAAFNPVRPFAHRFRLGKLTRRNHRKLLIVDGEVAFTGGVNLAQQWASEEEGGESWRDEIVEIRGPVLAELERAFRESWRHTCGQRLTERQVDATPVGRSSVAVLTQAGVLRRHQVLAAYLVRLRSARQRVFVCHAYFLPNASLRRALMRAARRGVDVRVIVPARCDVELVRLGSRAIWGRLLRAGVRIFEWQPTILHSKMAVVDRAWATVGSYNLDYLSARRNRELNVAILDPEFAGHADDILEAALAECTEVDPVIHRYRPLWARTIEHVLYWFRAWL